MEKDLASKPNSGSESEKAEKDNLVETMDGESSTLTLILVWHGKKFELEISKNATYKDLQLLCYSETSVRPENQKLFLRYKGNSCPDDVHLSELGLKNRQKLKLIGTAEDEVEALEISHRIAQTEVGLVLDDFDWDINPGNYTLWSRADADRALVKMVNRMEVNIINPPRQGKRLLVLDLDHTLLHFSRHMVNTSKHNEMLRPYMHKFLERVYRHYDIVIWSQTKWTWVEIKLTELGMLSNSKYSICFALDDSSMFKVVGFKNGKPKRHKVKALGLIWARFHHWTRQNSVHIDDLARNFAMNPECGLKCKPFRRDKEPEQDTELLRIAAYLELIATKHGDFSILDHNEWQKYLDDHENR
mmetsp:Transcript_10083/g.13213  ORF Transcript_10083/g.13213 Transcript_10083/m.13213 type:complete len:359 (+) Transcript_10083:311-1387(+)